MSQDLTEIFKKSLKSSRWRKLDFGTAKNYTDINVRGRWQFEKREWTWKKRDEEEID